jgi:glutathione peroxidase
MQLLYDRYHDLGLEILAFPCNNFGQQEPGPNVEIVKTARDKGATFPILGKLECEAGDKTAPIFTFLKDNSEAGLLGKPLRWNFTKFLCDANGKPTHRFGPQDAPLSFEPTIVKLLEAAGVDKEKLQAIAIAAPESK